MPRPKAQTVRVVEQIDKAGEMVKREFEHNGYRITVEPPNEVNSLTRVIVSTLHGTHVTEWIIGDEGIEKAREYIDGI